MVVPISEAFKIQGWTTEAELEWLRKTALGANSGDNIVEVGCWKGRATVALAVEGIYLACVDTFLGSPGDETRGMAEGEPIYSIFSANMARLGLTPQVIPLPSLQAARLFLRESVAMVVLDVDHEQFAADFNAWFPAVTPGGIIVAHDYHDQRWPNIAQAMAPYNPVLVPGTSFAWIGKE